MWNDWGRNLVTFINVWFCVDVVFNLDLYEVVRMTEKRFKMKKLEYESYFIDSQQEYIDKDEPNFKIDDERTMSDSQILDLLNENEELKQKIKFINEILNEDIGYIESFRKIEEVLKWLKNDLH